MWLYGDYAFVWALMTDSEVYFEEAHLYWALLNEGRDEPIRSLVELGAGGGYLADISISENLIMSIVLRFDYAFGSEMNANAFVCRHVQC